MVILIPAISSKLTCLYVQWLFTPSSGWRHPPTPPWSFLHRYPKGFMIPLQMESTTATMNAALPRTSRPVRSSPPIPKDCCALHGSLCFLAPKIPFRETTDTGSAVQSAFSVVQSQSCEDVEFGALSGEKPLNLRALNRSGLKWIPFSEN